MNPRVPCPYCGRVLVSNALPRHAETCLAPYTLERLKDVGGFHDLSDDECWPWPGTRAGEYPVMRDPSTGNLTRRHRFVCEMFTHMEPGHVARHSCHRPECVNPHHLSPGTRADNARDMIEAGRQAGSFWWSREQRLAAGLDARHANAANRRRRGERH